MTRVFDEIIDFISAGTTPRKVADWKPSEEVMERVTDLLAQEKRGQLGPDDQAELNHYLELEHLMRLAKARAQERLAHE